ncbi:aminomethyl-transferring glycine dehydrogenase subunit GcvPB [Carboxydocella sp. JDF658]|uniref:aminomethyl-transferring glycine dehydrogenase subunit GcvPB n=1 Tax=Carboxydocella sp. JDF658 TaxID=1926600 RepID=UPI0009AE847A|nr:aminomethyl-transferring glycine dehydrogenase subunit GcvPB [Carboxydocella sp. JDF658]GAW32293.1 glycine dehydrogenase (decarboxylating) beta subunit [Carboxydocella sp. JDF658]
MAKLIFELSRPGCVGHPLPDCDVPARELAELLPGVELREEVKGLPEVSEVEVIRHFTELSRLNHGVDSGFYPLGSCTMKYNPKINENTARLPGFAWLHPYQPEESIQGALELLYQTQEYLAEIAGLPAVTLQPAAGAHGEYTGMMIIRAYHESRGDKRTRVIVPDSAHGTNPATAAICGYSVVAVKSDERGCVDVEALKKVMDEHVAALMLTNPNTLGLFEENIREIAEIVHSKGGLLYYDGANANAIMGIARPGDMGFDVMHFNLHKTFSTPHGGGGPGSGPVAVRDFLAPFLPVPVVVKGEDGYRLDYDRPKSIGKVRSFYGNFGVAVKAYTYMRALGGEGLKAVSENAVLNANYLLSQLKQHYYLPVDRICKHEFVLNSKKQKPYGVRTMDIAKRLLDYGYHPPTVYFPLIVEEALMIEPTETESKQTLDEFIASMIKIAREAEENPELLTSAPHTTPIGRVDEARAARQPVLKWDGQ